MARKGFRARASEAVPKVFQTFNSLLGSIVRKKNATIVGPSKQLVGEFPEVTFDRLFEFYHHWDQIKRSVDTSHQKLVGAGIEIQSNNEYFNIFIEKWWKECNAGKKFSEYFLSGLITGNAIMEIQYTSDGRIGNIEHIPMQTIFRIFRDQFANELKLVQVVDGVFKELDPEFFMHWMINNPDRQFIQASGAIGNCQDEQIQSWRSNRSGSNINNDQQFSHFRLQPLHQPSSTPLILGQEVTHIRVTKGLGGTSKFTLAIYSGPGLGFPTCIGAGCSSPLNTQLRAFTDETSFVGTADNDFLDVPLLTPYFIDSTDHEDIQVCIAVNPVLQPGHNRPNPAQSWRSDDNNTKRRRITYGLLGSGTEYPLFPSDFLLNESDLADEAKFFQLVLAEPARQRECFDIDANIKLMPEKTFTVDGLINITLAIGGILDGILIKEGNTKEFIIDGIVKGLDINKTFTIDALPFDKPARLFSVNALLKEVDKTVDFFIDARIRQGNQTTFFIDGLPKGANTEITLIDARIVQTANQKVFGVDAKIAKLEEFTIDAITNIPTIEVILDVESVLGQET